MAMQLAECAAMFLAPGTDLRRSADEELKITDTCCLLITFSIVRNNDCNVVVASRVCKLVADVAVVDGNLSDRPSFDGVEIPKCTVYQRELSRSLKYPRHSLRLHFLPDSFDSPYSIVTGTSRQIHPFFARGLLATIFLSQLSYVSVYEGVTSEAQQPTLRSWPVESLTSSRTVGQGVKQAREMTVGSFCQESRIKIPKMATIHRRHKGAPERSSPFVTPSTP
ncbi:hypothetical protein BC629DRAFT_1721659, partial [Irpex lacteus]